MEEQDPSLDKKEENSKKEERIVFLIKTLKYFLFLFLLLGICFILWKVSSYMYTKTQVIESNLGEKTLDVYAKKVKEPALKTFDMGDFNFEIQPIKQEEMGAFIKSRIVIAYREEKGSKKNLELEGEIRSRNLQIKDLIRSLLIQKKYEEIRDPKQVSFLKEEFKNEINHILVNGKIADIYFTELDIIPKDY